MKIHVADCPHVPLESLGHDHIDCPLVGKTHKAEPHGDDHATVTCNACGIVVTGDPA